MDESKENRSPVFRFPKMMQTRTSVGIEEASISRDIQAHEDRKDQKKLVVQVIRTLLGGKMAQNDELYDHGCNQEIGIVTHIYFPNSYNNFEIFEYFLAGTGRTVPSVRVISKRRMDWTKSGFTMKLAWTRRKMSLYFFSSFEIDSVELNSPFKV